MIEIQSFSDDLTNVVFDKISIRFVLSASRVFHDRQNTLHFDRLKLYDSVIFTTPTREKIALRKVVFIVCEHLIEARSLVSREVAVVCTVDEFPGLNVLYRIHRCTSYSTNQSLSVSIREGKQCPSEVGLCSSLTVQQDRQ